MKRYLLTLYLFLTILATASEHKTHTYQEVAGLLKKIDKYAIIVGEGHKDIYVFIDPLCKYSRKFLHTASANSANLKKYRYHLFMYEIPRLHSLNTMYAIYHQDDPRQSLFSVMLEDIKPKIEEGVYQKEVATVKEIAEVAATLDVFKRPYIIVSEEE